MKRMLWIIAMVGLLAAAVVLCSCGQKNEEEWLDADSAMLVDTAGLDMTITKIDSDCFFGTLIVDASREIKVNGTLPEEWCVGDKVFVSFRMCYWDKNGRYEADMASVRATFSADDPGVDKKPVIYLYPEEERSVSVKLTYDGKLTCTYPVYENGWKVTAKPDGTLTDAKGQTYNYLYWEGESATQYDLSEGFCVAGADTAAFLEDALEKLGLTRREANEFIVYWLPMMEGNAYNIISFQTDVYTDAAKLDIDPAPDTLLRVFMAWKGSETFVKMEEQELTAPERVGFTAVEWGGSEVG